MLILLRNRKTKGIVSPYREMIKGAAWRVRWDYNGSSKSQFFGTQRDWTQTLITKINQLSAQIHKGTMRGGANVIVIPPELLGIIEGLEYYNSNNKTLGNRYKIIVDNTIHPSTILVYFDPPKNLEPLVDVNNRFFGVIKVDGLNEIDAEHELTSMLSEHIASQIDKEIINGLTKRNRRYLLIRK